MKLPPIFLIFLLSVSWEVSVLIMGTWTVDLFKDRQRAGFLICSSHSNPMFCVSSYSFPVPRAAAGCGRVSTGLKLKWHRFLFRLCRPTTSSRSTSENFKFPISALLTHICLLGSLGDALLCGSRCPISMPTDKHRFERGEDWGAELLQFWGSPFTRTNCPQARGGERSQGSEVYIVFCTKSGSFIATDQEGASSAQCW